MARKTYTREFKLQAVALMTDGGHSVSEVARQLGVSENCLRAWRDAAEQQGDAAFPGTGQTHARAGGTPPAPLRGHTPPRREAAHVRRREAELGQLYPFARLDDLRLGVQLGGERVALEVVHDAGRV